MFVPSDLSPWDPTPARPQEAGADPVQSAGSARVWGEDRSPWYVGDRYIANAFLAERERERQRARENRDAERRASRRGA